MGLSPSPRRAWIEICIKTHLCIALESPSPRRAWIEIESDKAIKDTGASRPPHGGRGLKSMYNSTLNRWENVALPTEGVD